MTTPTCQVRLTGQFATADLDRLLGILAPLETLETPTLVTVDLRALQFISATSVAVLVSTLLDIHAQGMTAEGSRILEPRSRDMHRRLQDLDVLDLLVDAPPGESFAHRQDRGSRPCQRFTAADDVAVLAHILTEAMAEVCHTDAPARHAMWYALNEIAQNVLDHAGGATGGVATAEATRGGTELEVVIADRGVGVRESLALNPTYRDLTSDLIALKTATEDGVTGRRGEPGGFGLYLTRLLLQFNGGGMVMRSGTAQLEVGASCSERFGLADMRGTLVTLRFLTNQPLSLDPILSAVPNRSG